MGGRKKSCLLALIFVVILPGLGICGLGVFAYIAYTHQKAMLGAEIQRLPGFDTEATGREVAEALKIEYPVRKTTESLDVLRAKVKEDVKKAVSNRYSARAKSKGMFSVMKKYAMAKKGSNISFCLMRRAGEGVGKIIRGKYKGKASGGASGEMISVGNKQYPYMRVDSESRYLFNERESKLLQTRGINSFKKKFKEDKKAYSEQFSEECENKYFKKAGYSKSKDDAWEPAAKAFNEEMKKKRAKFQKKRKSNIKKLIDKNKVLGILKIKFKRKEIKALLSDENDDEGGNKEGIDDAREETPEKKK